jgi:hypothetical protein
LWENLTGLRSWGDRSICPIDQDFQRTKRPMDEIKLHNVQPVPGQKPSERTLPKGPVQAGAFEQALRKADALMDGVNQNLTAPARSTAAGGSPSIQTEFQESQRLFQQTMEVKNVLARLFLDMTKTVNKG